MDERVAYGLISKGNGETILTKEKHMSLVCGGGEAGQGYPAVMICDVQMDGGVKCYEHSITKHDKRWKPVCVMATSCWNAPFTDGTISPSLCARAGTGGNQLPLIVLSRDSK